MVIAIAEFLGLVSPHGSAVLVAEVAEAPPVIFFRGVALAHQPDKV